MPFEQGEIRNIPQNEPLGRLSDALAYLRELARSLSAVQTPTLGPIQATGGLGEALLGKKPEIVEDLSFGMPPTRGTGWATSVRPDYAADIADVLPQQTAAKAAVKAIAGQLAATKGLPLALGAVFKPKLDSTTLPPRLVVDKSQSTWNEAMTAARQQANTAGQPITLRYGSEEVTLYPETKTAARLPPTTAGNSPLFLDKAGSPIGNAVGMDSHGTLLNKLGVDNSVEESNKLGLYYVDSGGPTHLIITGKDQGPLDTAKAVAQKYANSRKEPVRLHYDEQMILISPNSS